MYLKYQQINSYDPIFLKNVNISPILILFPNNSLIYGSLLRFYPPLCMLA